MEPLNAHVMNLANSIIGVSILAMPYCFKQCGIILSIILLLISSVVSRLTCHYLLKSAILSRRKTFEFLAFHLFGGIGKLAIEIGMICFQLGTCIAYFVVMGDLGPVIVSEVTKAHVTSTMRTSILMALALFVILPLGLLRNVHSLNSVSKATMIFYCCLVLRIVIEALPVIFEDNWHYKVNFWRPEGLLQCIPIFSMALFCQTQLFEMYEVVPNPSLDRMNILIRHAVTLCTSVYICVGIFGYIAFANKPFSGNVLLSFEPGFISHIMKVGFIFSIAFSFPLVIFPCRASLYSCLYKEGYSVHEGNLNYIPEGKFKGLTMLIVCISLVIGILIPNIELVLGLVGSTIGVMICVLFPVTCFICVSQKNTNERLLAQFLLMVGVFVMVVGTYKNLQTIDQIEQIESVLPATKSLINQVEPNQVKIENINKLAITEKLEVQNMVTEKIKEVRHEPPQPVEPVEEEPKKDVQPKVPEKVDVVLPPEKLKPVLSEKVKPILPKENIVNGTRNDQVDIEAIKKEDKEELLEKSEKEKDLDKDDDHKVLIESIQKQNEVQKEIVEQQKKLLEVIKKQQKVEDEKKMDEVKQEKMKAVKEIESIALKAIEKISEGEDAKKVVDDMKKGIKESELKEKEVEEVVNNEHVGNKNIKKEPVKEDIPKGDEPSREKPEKVNDIKEKREEEDFEKNVDNVKKEVQELSSQLNEIDKQLKKDQQIPQSIPLKDIIERKNKLDKVPNEKESNNEENINNIQNHNEQNFLLKPQEVVEKKNDISNVNRNNSLFLKIGKKEVQINDEKDPSKLLPLPIAMSKNKDSVLTDIETKHDKLQILENQQNTNDVQAMRRDILSVPSKNKILSYT